MEFTDKARIRIEHWIEHNRNHLREYEKFAAELKESGAVDCAGHIHTMVELTRRAQLCLEQGLAALGAAPGH